MSPYQNISEQKLFCIYSEWILGKLNFLIAELWNFRHFCEPIKWKIVRRWYHQLTHLICCSKNVSLKITKFQNFISSLFSIWFYQIFTVLFKFLNSFYWLKLNLDRTSLLTRTMNRGQCIVFILIHWLPPINSIVWHHICVKEIIITSVTGFTWNSTCKVNISTSCGTFWPVRIPNWILKRTKQR